MKRIWMMDGHNIIFAVRGLHELQISGRGDEARSVLVDRLRRFAQARSEQVLIVFDGNDQQTSRDALREPFLETVYRRRSEGGADDRILHEAASRAERGQHVTVVTNDVRTVAVKLPKRALHMRVHAFWLKYIEPTAAPGEKPIEGDFSDIEREMEDRAAALPPGPKPAGPIRAPRKPTPPAAVEMTAESSRRKKERGRLRQERLLERRRKPPRSR